jgi:hypothetical protein
LFNLLWGQKSVGCPLTNGFDVEYQNRECQHFMNKNIHSSLDLSESLSKFKEKVTKLLEIKNRNMDEFISTATGERCKILVRERNYEGES